MCLSIASKCDTPLHKSIDFDIKFHEIYRIIQSQFVQKRGKLVAYTMCLSSFVRFTIILKLKDNLLVFAPANNPIRSLKISNFQ